MKEIQLTQGQVALIDDEDFELINQYKWFALYDKTTNGYYARTNIKIRPGRRTQISMHRLIMDAKASEQIDHKNNNGLDNRKQNLRIVTQAQNNANQRKRKDNKSGYKGVFAKDGRYQVYIKREYKGTFESAEVAAIQYDLWAIELYGEFAKTNFPIQDYEELKD